MESTQKKIDYHSKSTSDTRLRRGGGEIDGTTVSVTADITNEKLKESLAKDIASGIYSRGIDCPTKICKIENR